jgi:nucleotide-binding universal stress UspA family protein
VTYPDSNSDAVAANATSLATFLGADLHAAALVVDIPNVSNLLARVLVKLPELIREAEALSRKHGDHLLALVRAEAAERAVGLTTGIATAALPLVGETAASDARYLDMSILGWEAGNTTSRSIAEAVIFGSGRPVVLLPSTTTIRTIGHVAIAWDGSRVAARAVADAMPFLQRASKVSVLTVVDEKPLKDRDIGQRLVSSLSKKGIAADAFSIGVEASPIGISLQDHAITHGADLLVMGAYGHSVVREFVLGGATRDVLGDLRLPVLVSH